MVRPSTIKYSILFVFLLFIGCRTTVVEETKQTAVIDRPDHESWDVHITISNAGIKRADIKADHLKRYNDKNYISLENNVVIDFYNSEAKHMSKLTAQKTEINERTNYLQAMNNVVVKSDSGVTLFTDTLAWDDTKQLIFSEDYVMITTESNDTLYGFGFESDVSMDRWKILKPRGVTGK